MACSSLSKNYGVIINSFCDGRFNFEYQVLSIPKQDSLIPVTLPRTLFFSCSFLTSTYSAWPICTSFSYFSSISYLFFLLSSTSSSAFAKVYKSLRSLLYFFSSYSISIFRCSIIDSSSLFFCSPSSKPTYFGSDW